MRRWSLVLALLAAAPASAATPEALAAKQLAAAENAARTTFRAALSAAQIQLNAALANVETALSGAATPTAPGEALFTALVAFQVDVFEAENLASNAQADAAKTALASLATDLNGIYPAAFYPGDGSATAGFEKAIEKDAAKAYAKVGKRLAKVAARFSAEGFALRFRLRPPTATDSRSWSEDVVDFLTGLPPTLDLALAWSDLAVQGDGQLRGAGTGTRIDLVGTGPVQIAAFAHPGADVFVDETAEPAGNRWSSDFGGQSFAEGVYLLVANQTGIPGDDVSIGVP
jgi:hypothetical protein